MTVWLSRTEVDRDAGWEHRGCHDLRWAWATAFASAGVDPFLM